jgi:hypothetical protein
MGGHGLSQRRILLQTANREFCSDEEDAPLEIGELEQRRKSDFYPRCGE